MAVSLLDGTYLNYMGHQACIRKTVSGSWKAREQAYMVALIRIKDKVSWQDQSRLEQVTWNGTCFATVPHELNSTELSWEEFR